MLLLLIEGEQTCFLAVQILRSLIGLEFRMLILFQRGEHRSFFSLKLANSLVKLLFRLIIWSLEYLTLSREVASQFSRSQLGESLVKLLFRLINLELGVLMLPWNASMGRLLGSKSRMRFSRSSFDVAVLLERQQCCFLTFQPRDVCSMLELDCCACCWKDCSEFFSAVSWRVTCQLKLACWFSCCKESKAIFLVFRALLSLRAT